MGNWGGEGKINVKMEGIRGSRPTAQCAAGTTVRGANFHQKSFKAFENEFGTLLAPILGHQLKKIEGNNLENIWVKLVALLNNSSLNQF